MPEEPTVNDFIATAQRAIEILQGASKDNERSRYPYFNPSMGESVMLAVDEVLRTGQPMIWPCNEITLNTQYLKFRQGAQWVRERLADPAAIAKLDAVEVQRLPKIGLRIAPREKRNSIKLYYESNWKSELSDFLIDSVPPQKFERVGVPISDDDIIWIYEQLAPIKHLFVTDISTKKILLIRYDNSRSA